jgi:aminopeptidase
MDKGTQKKYAEVVLKKGINLYRGQCLTINAAPDDLEFALVLEEEAYRLGAKLVDLNIKSNLSTKYRILHSDKDALSFVPSFVSSEMNEKIAHDWASIRIDNTGEIDVLADADPTMLDVLFRSARVVRKRFLEMSARHILTWCVIASPNPKWATKVLGSNPDNETFEIFDKVIHSILRLDCEDPVEAWSAHDASLRKRCAILNNLKIDKLLFKNSTTDLEIGLTPESIFQGGAKETPDGRWYIPNIPTEEVFTTPDYRRTNGTVRCTRPVRVMETELNNVWFTFKNGRVEDFGADSRRQVLENFINTDDGARRLGEVALVDRLSPIYKSGLVFSSILYDENASCHIALGKGYPSCLRNGMSLNTDEALLNGGCNTSLVHTDFMIGSDDLSVTAVDASGKSIQILDQGTFVI